MYFLNPHQVVVLNVRSGENIEISASRSDRGVSNRVIERMMLSTCIKKKKWKPVLGKNSKENKRWMDGWRSKTRYRKRNKEKIA